MFLRKGHGPEHTFQAQIGQRICANKVAYLFHRAGTSYQLTFARKINAVKTRETNRRAAHPHMYFAGSSLSQSPCSQFAGGSSHNGIVDDYYFLPLEYLTHRVELEPYPEIPDGRRRLYERASHVMITDDAIFVRQSAALRVPHAA